jgi:hypothetical protein
MSRFRIISVLFAGIFTANAQVSLNFQEWMRRINFGEFAGEAAGRGGGRGGRGGTTPGRWLDGDSPRVPRPVIVLNEASLYGT